MSNEWINTITQRQRKTWPGIFDFFLKGLCMFFFFSRIKKEVALIFCSSDVFVTFPRVWNLARRAGPPEETAPWMQRICHKSYSHAVVVVIEVLGLRASSSNRWIILYIIFCERLFNLVLIRCIPQKIPASSIPVRTSVSHDIWKKKIEFSNVNCLWWFSTGTCKSYNCRFPIKALKYNTHCNASFAILYIFPICWNGSMYLWAQHYLIKAKTSYLVAA